MSHITSSWAAEFGLHDPERTAADLRAADGTAATAAERTLRSAALASCFADSPLERAQRTVAASWSAEQPSRALQTLTHVHQQVDDVCTRTSGTAGALAAAIERAHTEAAQAYAAADVTIATQRLIHYQHETHYYVQGAEWTDPIISPAEIQRVDSGRRSVVHALNAALAAVSQRLDAAATQTEHFLAADPWTTLPAAVQPAVAHGGADIDRANRAALLADLLWPGRRHELAAGVLRALDAAVAQGETAQLLVYDPDDPPTQGSVAISIGNVDTAADVAVVVPGIGNSPAAIGDSIADAARLGAAVQAEGGSAHGPTATVLWFGYDIPLSWPSDPGSTTFAQKAHDTLIATSAATAATAAQRLAAFTGTLRGIVPAAASLTLVGHSWGSMVVSQALRLMGRDAGVTRGMLLAPPGAGYWLTSAMDYRAVDPDDVYVIAFPGDPVPNDALDDLVGDLSPVAAAKRRKVFGYEPGPFGPNPADPAFGASVIAVPSEHQAAYGVDFATHALDNYLDGRSLATVAAVVAGNTAHLPVRGRK